ncbi:MAG: putative metal-dependent hydrolase [Calditrichaeota bacterium]|nr:MAG: putative metal-dependent hydrolase [Calditrichota bacterium]
MEDLRYPIGQFIAPNVIEDVHIQEWIEEIKNLPAAMRKTVAGLTDEQLDTPYREGGWTVRQVVHHVADSHLNSMIRYKWALTEDKPVIKAYNEKLWAELPDTKLDIALSLNFLDAFHEKWIAFLKTLSRDQLQREFYHPEAKRIMALDWMTGLYAWHGKHHVAHITSLRERKRW